MGTGASVTSYVTVTTSVRLVPASSLIAAIFHFKCLRVLGQRQPEAGAALSDNISAQKTPSSSDQFAYYSFDIGALNSTSFFTPRFKITDSLSFAFLDTAAVIISAATKFSDKLVLCHSGDKL